LTLFQIFLFLDKLRTNTGGNDLLLVTFLRDLVFWYRNEQTKIKIDMNECIFGIKCNGVSINVMQISIDSDQSVYDYICNVSLKESCNGNGTYDVSIINKDYIQGMPVGKWRIKEAWITYDWGSSYSKLIMEDEDGNETSTIYADDQKGSASGFHLPSLTRTIFTKAQEVVRDYPNANICNAIMELNESKEHFNLSYYIKRHKEVSNKSDKEYIDFMEYAANNITKYIRAYKATAELLEKNDDPRSVRLLKNITSECRRLLDNFKVSDI